MATKREMNLISLAAALVQNTELQEEEARKMEEKRKEQERTEREKKEKEANERKEKNEAIGLEVIQLVHQEMLRTDKSSSNFRLHVKIVFDDKCPGINVLNKDVFFVGYTFYLSGYGQTYQEEWMSAVLCWIQEYLKGAGGKFLAESMREDTYTQDYCGTSRYVIIRKCT